MKVYQMYNTDFIDCKLNTFLLCVTSFNSKKEETAESC